MSLMARARFEPHNWPTPLNAFQRTARQIFAAREDSWESTAMQVNGQGAWPLTSVAQSPIPEALAIMPRVNGQEIVPGRRNRALNRRLAALGNAVKTAPVS